MWKCYMRPVTSQVQRWEQSVGHDPCEEVVVVDRLNKKTE